MGCTGSKEPEPLEIELVNAQPASGFVPRQTPRQKRDPVTGRPNVPANESISSNTLRQALSDVAAYINRSRRTVTVIAVGGAVNTILLRTRDATHDVDFFHSSTTASESSLISQAGRYADQENSSSLGENWFNNQTSFFMPRDLLKQLTRAAEAQNEVVFQKPGLRVLAAPWEYAFFTDTLEAMTTVP